MNKKSYCCRTSKTAMQKK